MYAWKIVAFILMLNVAIGIVNATGVFKYTVAYNVEEGKVGYKDIVSRWNPVTLANIPIVGDIVSGLYFLYEKVGWVIDGFPALLSQLGTPAPIVWGLRIVFYFIVALSIIEFISGRRGWD